MSPELWGWYLDSYAGSAWGSPLRNWRAWLTDLRAPRSRALSYVELFELVERWDLRPAVRETVGG